MEFYDFPYIGNVIIPTYPNWQTPSFFRGVGLNHQPDDERCFQRIEYSGTIFRTIRMHFISLTWKNLYWGVYTRYILPPPRYISPTTLGRNQKNSLNRAEALTWDAAHHDDWRLWVQSPEGYTAARLAGSPLFHAMRSPEMMLKPSYSLVIAG